MKFLPYTWTLVLCIGTSLSFAQQNPDTTQFFTIDNPHYELGMGPKIAIDAGHNNFHKLDGRYTACGNILRADGYQLFSEDRDLSREVLNTYDVYLIANALPDSIVGNWVEYCKCFQSGRNLCFTGVGCSRW